MKKEFFERACQVSFEVIITWSEDIIFYLYTKYTFANTNNTFKNTKYLLEIYLLLEVKILFRTFKL